MINYIPLLKRLAEQKKRLYKEATKCVDAGMMDQARLLWAESDETLTRIKKLMARDNREIAKGFKASSISWEL